MVEGEYSSEFYQRKYLEIFRYFCIVGQKVVTNNQLIILHEFIEKIKNIPNGDIYQLDFKLEDS